MYDDGAATVGATIKLEGLSQSVSSLERLRIKSEDAPDNYDNMGDWGETLLAIAPRLHTIILDSSVSASGDTPGAPRLAWDRQLHLQLGWPQQWDKHTSALRRLCSLRMGFARRVKTAGHGQTR
ncbi:hypothetical protein OH77DRAFT_1240902 [Trametes cingulata]|nr:hypothetical protein OH77DRAFT_1240902 [Trametes cingulata]